MNEQPLNNEPLDRREARRQRHEERLAAPSRGGAWVAGVILIVLGIAFLFQNTGNFTIPLRNWWALFILIPAIGAFERAWQMYRDAGNHLTAQTRSSLLVGLVLTLVTAAFLFNINWTFFGPALIILAGLGILINAILPGKE